MAVGGFSACLANTLREEGGLSNDPGDPGGLTNKGITHATYDAYRASKGLYPRSVAQIADDEIRDIYITNYWTPIGAETLPAGVDLSAFDYAVNSGPARARRALIAAMDGKSSVGTIIDNICGGQLSFMHALGTWKSFGKGWAARVARIEAESLQMAGLSPAPNAASARAKADAHKIATTAAGGVGASGIFAGPAHFAGWVVAAAVAIAAVVALVNAFNAWRQSQRADALDQAVSDLQAKAKAAAAAQAASTAAKTAAASAIAAEEQKIASAKAAVASAAAPGVVTTPHQTAIDAASSSPAPAPTGAPAAAPAPAPTATVIPMKGSAK